MWCCVGVVAPLKKVIVIADTTTRKQTKYLVVFLSGEIKETI